jgi:hypothetical protein
MPLVRGEQIATWGDPNKANGYFGTEEKSRDAIAGDFQDIPIVDISGIFSPDLKDRQAVADQVRDACIRVGFVCILLFQETFLPYRYNLLMTCSSTPKATACRAK